MSIRVWVLVLISWAAVGCQGQRQSQERKQAPANAKDLGVLVETSQPGDVDAILKAYPDAQVRRLNPNHGLYEFFGLTREQIESVVPQAQVSPNEFFEFKVQSVAAPKGLKVDGLNPCKTAEAYPTASASVVEPQGARQSFTIELGTKVKLSAAKSKASLLFPSVLKTAVVVIPPDSSQQKESVQLQTDIEITPDALGAYHVFFVVQDSRDVCSMDAVQFIATANRPYRPTPDGGRVDTDKLTHLKVLNAQESWAKSQGEGILIAIVDTGVNYNHPLLNGNIEINANEVPGNQSDDDQNGFVDDQLGYDFVNSDPFPYDDDGHGTHVAGLVAARQMGMAQKAHILAVKAMTSIGGDAGSIGAGIQYAVDRGAKIINLSLGATGPAPHPMIVKAINYAEQHGVLVVVAAGNGDPQTGLGFDIDQTPVYPAALPNANIVSVAASDSINALTPYSNFGKVGVDITAPGGFGKDPIISTAFENPGHALFVGMSGTSMASPIVAGVAAQVWSLDRTMTVAQVKEILLKGGPEDNDLIPITVSGRHLNALTAVSLVKPSNVLF